MLERHRFLTLLTFMIVFGLFVVACERPLSSNDEDSTPVSNEDPELVTEEATESSGTSSETIDAEAEDTESEAQEEPSDQERDESPRPEDAAPEEESIESEAASEEMGEESEESSASEESDEPEEADASDENEVEEAAADASDEAADEETPAEDVPAEEESSEDAETEGSAMEDTDADATPMEEPETVDSAEGETTEDDVSGEQVNQTPATHVVAPGENLYRIGLSYGMSWIPIAEANGITNPNQIYAGQVLKIPASVPGPKPEFTHVVQRGETLSQIALRYGVPVQSIVAANNLSSPNVIYAGQILIIPGV